MNRRPTNNFCPQFHLQHKPVSTEVLICEGFFFLVYEVLINDPLMTGAQNTEECHDSGKLIVIEDIFISYEDLKSQVN